MDGWHHHARAESDPLEESAIASGNSGIIARRELSLRHVFKFEHVDQVRPRRDAGRQAPGSVDEAADPPAAEWPRPCDPKPARAWRLVKECFAHRKCVLTKVRSIEARSGLPVCAIAITSSACRISITRCTPAGP